MPCERKHIEAIQKLLWDADLKSLGRHTILDIEIALGKALAACDESPCAWEMVGGRVLRPSCLGENPHVMWSMWSHGNMTYCPHCGRKIAPLPASPEVGNV